MRSNNGRDKGRKSDVTKEEVKTISDLVASLDHRARLIERAIDDLFGLRSEFESKEQEIFEALVQGIDHVNAISNLAPMVAEIVSGQFCRDARIAKMKDALGLIEDLLTAIPPHSAVTRLIDFGDFGTWLSIIDGLQEKEVELVSYLRKAASDSSDIADRLLELKELVGARLAKDRF